MSLVEWQDKYGPLPKSHMIGEYIRMQRDNNNKELLKIIKENNKDKEQYAFRDDADDDKDDFKGEIKQDKGRIKEAIGYNDLDENTLAFINNDGDDNEAVDLTGENNDNDNDGLSDGENEEIEEEVEDGKDKDVIIID